MFINFNKSKKDDNNNEFDFISKDYKMADEFNCENLMVGKLEYVSSKVDDFGPKYKTSNLYYIFEVIEVDSKIRYREIFTGFIADTEIKYFDLPYVVDINKITNILPSCKDTTVPKLGMLLVLNDVNNAIKNKEKDSEDKVLNKKKD